MLRKYETLFILRPDLPAETFDRIKTKLTESVERDGGHTVTYMDWGKRKMAYPIESVSKGNYVYYRYLGTGEIVKEVERLLRMTDESLRYMTVVLGEGFDPATFDFEADRKDIYPFGARPREDRPDGMPGFDQGMDDGAYARDRYRDSGMPDGDRGRPAPEVGAGEGDAAADKMGEGDN
jgi:small subunit ribosomal protein S6